MMPGDETDALRRVLAEDSGKIILWGLLSRCGLFCSSYTPDASAAAFREGRRSIGLELLQMMDEVDRTAFPSMMIEHAKNLLETKNLERSNPQPLDE